jgi:hypothetical protein
MKTCSVYRIQSFMNLLPATYVAAPTLQSPWHLQEMPENPRQRGSLYMARLKSGFKTSVSLWYHSKLNQSYHHPVSITTTLVILILMIMIRRPGVIAIIPPHGLKHIQYLRNSRFLLIDLNLFGILPNIRMNSLVDQFTSPTSNLQNQIVQRHPPKDVNVIR